MVDKRKFLAFNMDYAQHNAFDSFGKEGEKWVGFDLDATLAQYDKWRGIDHIGEPVKSMVLAAKQMHDAGKKIKIFTARVADPEDRAKAKKHIESWCKKHLGFVPEVTHEKDALMEFCFDDRSEQVFPNTGIPVMEAFNDAMDIIKDLTDGFRNCNGHFSVIERLVALQQMSKS